MSRYRPFTIALVSVSVLSLALLSLADDVLPQASPDPAPTTVAPESPTLVALTPEETARHAVLAAAPLQTLTNVDLGEYISLRQKALAASPRPLTPGDHVGHFAVKAMNQPFRLNAWRYDLAEADCTTCVERSLALGLATDWRSYHMICNRLRHKDGRESS